MRTIADSIRDVLRQSPFLSEALAQGIINHSALARQLRPQLEQNQLRPFTEGAIIMALKRMQVATPSARAQVHVASSVRNITVRSNLVEYAFQNSQTLLKAQEKLIALSEREEDAFVTIARGVFETALIVSASLEGKLREFTAGETCIKQFHRLSSISIRFHPDTAHVPGVYYPFFQSLAWHGINFIEVVSGFSELTFLFEDAEIDRAFPVIKALTEDKTGASQPMH